MRIETPDAFDIVTEEVDANRQILARWKDVQNATTTGDDTLLLNHWPRLVSNRGRPREEVIDGNPQTEADGPRVILQFRQGHRPLHQAIHGRDPDPLVVCRLAESVKFPDSTDTAIAIHRQHLVRKRIRCWPQVRGMFRTQILREGQAEMLGAVLTGRNDEGRPADGLQRGSDHRGASGLGKIGHDHLPALIDFGNEFSKLSGSRDVTDKVSKTQGKLRFI